MSHSEKFEGIPIYPDSKLVKRTGDIEYIERYETEDLSATFEELKNFYINNIDQERWTMEENPLYGHEENRFVETIGYILKNKEKEVSLTLTKLKKDEDGNGPLHIIINGSPLKEGKLQVNGASNYWEITLEYTIMKDTLSAIGDLTYIGDTPPKEVEYEFTMYQTSEEKLQIMGGAELNALYASKNFGGGNHRQVDLEIFKEAINKANMELKWEDQGRKITEKIELDIVSSSASTVGGVDGPDHISITTSDNGIDADIKEGALPENIIMLDAEEWPQNEYTTNIPPPESGELSLGWIKPDQEYCYIQLSDITQKESEQYVKDLKEVGFIEVEKVSEEINDDYLSVGILLKNIVKAGVLY